MANKTDGEVEKSIISSDMKIKGKITASGGLVLLGNVVGDIKCNSLSIEESGFLKGNIDAELVSIAGKFDGQVFTFDFKRRNIPCIRSFFQEKKISDDILNCEYGGILGTIAGIIGTMQANEILKKILKIGKNLNGQILILDLLNLNFRKSKFYKIKNA